MAEQRADQAIRSDSLDRRTFLETGAALVAAGSAINDRSDAIAQDASKSQPKIATDLTVKVGPVPTRKLGKTGVDVSILNLGTWKCVGLDRILRYAWANGIRYVDTAKSYG